MTTRPVHFFFLYGMWGPLTDPGARVFTDRVHEEFPDINVHQSPYRDFDVPTVVAEIKALSTDPKPIVFVAGTSLGCNNAPVVGQYLDGVATIHGMFGFQASYWGAHSVVTKNVLFAHEFYSLNPVNMQLGAYRWPAAADNKNTVLTDERDLVHPGDTDLHSQDVFLTEMKRIMMNPGD